MAQLSGIHFNIVPVPDVTTRAACGIVCLPDITSRAMCLSDLTPDAASRARDCIVDVPDAALGPAHTCVFAHDDTFRAQCVCICP